MSKNNFGVTFHLTSGTPQKVAKYKFISEDIIYGLEYLDLNSGSVQNPIDLGQFAKKGQEGLFKLSIGHDSPSELTIAVYERKKSGSPDITDVKLIYVEAHDAVKDEMKHKKSLIPKHAPFCTNDLSKIQVGLNERYYFKPEDNSTLCKISLKGVEGLSFGLSYSVLIQFKYKDQSFHGIIDPFVKVTSKN